MHQKIILFIFIMYIWGLNASISDEIWNKTKNYIKQGKMIVNTNKTHFIFDEYNYTKLDINNTKMQDLYNRQEKIYKKYNITTYIFLLQYLDFSDTLLKTIIKNIKIHLENEFKIDANNSIISLISIKSRKVIISEYPKIFRKSYLAYYIFIFFLKISLRKIKYYEVVKKIIEDIYKSYYSYYIMKIIAIIFLIFIVIIFIIFISIIIFSKDSKKDVQKSSIKRIPFYKEIDLNKNEKYANEDIFMKLLKEEHEREEASKYCSICSKKFSDNNDTDNEKEEKIAEDLDSVTLRLLNKNGNEKINTFKCGHKFHTNCITKLPKSNNNLNNDCPICNKTRRRGRRKRRKIKDFES